MHTGKPQDRQNFKQMKQPTKDKQKKPKGLNSKKKPKELTTQEMEILAQMRFVPDDITERMIIEGEGLV